MDLDDEELEATRMMFNVDNKYIYEKKFRKISYEGKEIWLTKAEDKIFNLLRSKKQVTYEELYKEIYDIELQKASAKQRNAIITKICRLNKKIYKIAEIINITGIGYALKESSKVQ